MNLFNKEKKDLPKLKNIIKGNFKFTYQRNISLKGNLIGYF